MTGETPDDIEARRVANEKVIRDAIASAFQKPIPAVVPRDPTPAPPRDTSRMSDTGQYRELRADVENLKTNFADLRHDIDARFKEQQSESREQHRELVERFDKSMEMSNSSKPTLEKGATVLFGAISLVLTLVWGYSTLTQGAITDKVAATNDRITREQRTTADDVGRIEKSIGLLTDSMAKRADKVDTRFDRMLDDTVPRREADNRFERDELTLSHKVDKDVFSKTTEYRDDQVASLRKDVAALIQDTQKRADLDARFGDFTKRLDLISNRVEQLQQSSAGTAILQEQLRECQSQIKELRDHWLNVAATTK